MERLVYYIFRFFAWLFSLFSFRQLYVFSDILCFFFYRIVQYRKKVVIDNLRNSFPDKTEAEISIIATGFYKHLFDVITESLKAFSMTEKSVIDRYQFIKSDELEALFLKNQSAICVAGHFNNWEWAGIAAGSQLKHKPVGFYKPLTNKLTDAYIQRVRAQGRAALVSITKTSEVFKADYGEPTLFYMVADQSPSSPRLAYWINFLNQDTAVLHGPEKYARLYNYPVFYIDVQKIKRGYYTVSFIQLELDPLKTKTGEITTRFMNLLEEKIRENPTSYLWSHRRWKLKRPNPR
jgi:Kdo2-lipid IVA lauroyltransferase/acyltransferase